MEDTMALKIEANNDINPVPIEERFLKNSYIKQANLMSVSLPQPVLLVVLSEVASKLERKEVIKSLRKTFTSANKNFVASDKVSHIIVVKEAWTTDTDREAIQAKYVELAKEVITRPEPIVWE